MKLVTRSSPRLYWCSPVGRFWGSTRESVMIIDDDPRLNRLLQMVLESAGYQVMAFTEAQAALSALDSDTPDVIVLDLRMPGMDGFEFYSEVQKRGVEVPIVVASAFGATQAKEQMGAAAALAKPFMPDDLVSVVRRLLDS
jgi:DNA-binding response OmpR family regulator